MFAWLNEKRAAWLVGRSRHRVALADMPQRVRSYWQLHAGAEFEGIPRDAFFYARASEGLMDFFSCIQLADGKPCALPSKAADSVWHAWQHVDPIGLDRFTVKHFGQRIPHLPATAMASDMVEGLARSLVLSRPLDRIAPEGPGIPRLFALDGAVKMPQGYGYRMRKGELGYSILDSRGRAGNSMLFPPALAAAGLLAAGMISQSQYEAALVRRDEGGSSCGSSGSSSSSDSDCDSGGDSSDGGSSCGSSCGGGCGGGD